MYSDNVGNPKTFTTTYDVGLGAVTNLSMRDDQDNPITWTSSGVDTTDPIVSWDPVPGAASYEVEVSPFIGRRVRLEHQDLRRHNRYDELDAAWHGARPGGSVAEPADARDRQQPAQPGQLLLRARPRAAKHRHEQPRRRGHADRRRRRHPPVVQLHGLPDRRRLPVVHGGLPGRGRLRAAPDRAGLERDAALHVEADRRRRELLRRRRDRCVVPERDRLRVHADACLRPTERPAGDRLPGLDLLLGGAAGAELRRDGGVGHGPTWRRPRRSRSSRPPRR